MINDMLDIAKLESWKMEFKDEIVIPYKIASAVVEGLSFLAKQRWLTLVCEYTPGIENLQIYVDSAKLRQVLINIIGNALKFTPHWGRITLHLSQVDEDVLFEIIDTGIGIPESNLSKIFEKFKQVDNYLQKSVSGTWLGLYICKKILSHFGSDLKVTSEEGIGSNFYFKIRIAD
jgi:signal transduction histidine kinase